MKIAIPILAATMSVQIAADPDGPLEPSVLNEVEHALDRAQQCPTNAPPVTSDILSTNGLSATATAISLISRQDKDGNWIVNGTNATAEAVKILTALSGRNTNTVNNAIIPAK